MNLHRLNRMGLRQFLAAITVLLSVMQLTACDQAEQPNESVALDDGEIESSVQPVEPVENKKRAESISELSVSKPEPSQKVLDKLSPVIPRPVTNNVTKSINNHAGYSGQTTQKKNKPAPGLDRANLENYSVKVSATEKLVIPGPPGELNVWIGISSKAPENQPGMVAGTKPLEAVGETAKVTPFTLGIDVEPEVSKCEKIDPSGSEVSFKLLPTVTGNFKVGASVALYDSNDCSGVPVPKSAKSVTVKVSVDEARAVSGAFFSLLKSTWEAFLDFWDKFLILIFALLLYLIRKKLYKLFGFKSDEQ